MTSPLLEKDLNTLDNEIAPAQRLTKSSVQAAAMKKFNYSLLKMHGGNKDSSQSSSAWQESMTGTNREQSKKLCQQLQDAKCYSGNPAPAPAGPVGVPSLNMGVEDMLTHIRRSKLTEGRPVKPILPSRHQPQHDSTDNVCLVGEDSGRIKWIQPSGPRRSGEGTEDEEQGIVSAETTASGGAVVRITLLAAGFIIGPSGSSVREISKQTGADIKSWTEKATSVPGRPNRPIRSFVVEGKRRAVVLALDIICDAVDRYKELCEGAFCGQFVARIQKVRGVDFSYQPPPRNIVPYAAALKGQHPRLSRAEPVVPAAPIKRGPTQIQPPAVSTESMSTTSNDIISDMDEDLSPAAAHKAEAQHIHSKADVMNSYLNPYPKSTPNAHSHNSVNSNKLQFNNPGMISSSLNAINQTSSAQYQSDFSTAQPGYMTDSAEPVNTWLEHCKLGSSFQPNQAHVGSRPALSPTAPPVELVQVRPNVWLPSSALQQAQGDFGLAVHIAARGSNSDNVPTDDDSFNWSAESPWNAASAQFGTKQARPDSPSPMQFDNPYAFPKASYEQDHSKKQFASAAMFSTPRSNTTSPIIAADAQRGFGAAGASQAVFNTASKFLPDNQQQYNFSSTGGDAASAFAFKSPVVGMPYVDPSNSFISPQCVLDNNSLFSYNLNSGTEHTPKPSNTGWYANSTSPFCQVTPGLEPGSSNAPFGGISGSENAPLESWPAFGNYWGPGTGPFSAGQVDGSSNTPNKQHCMYSNSASAPYSGNAHVSAWAGHAVKQPQHNDSQSSKLQPGDGTTANPQAGFWSPLKMPWVHGSHPLLKGKGPN